jgi:hypothetical protein
VKICVCISALSPSSAFSKYILVYIHASKTQPVFVSGSSWPPLHPRNDVPTGNGTLSSAGGR